MSATTRLPLRRLFATSRMALASPSWKEWRLQTGWPCSSDSPMINHHPDLPKFPIPSLQETASKLKRSGKPLARNAQEFEAFEKEVDSFVQKDGPKLQRRLEQLAAESRNWLAQDWDTLAYMSYRDPVVLNVSYFYGFAKLPQHAAGTSKAGDDPAYVAASIILSGLDFRDKLIDGSLPPDANGPVKLDMEHYKWMFNACRIPHANADYAVKIPDSDPAGDHFIVVRHNQFFKLPIKDANGKRFGLNSIQKTLQNIYDDVHDIGALPIGVLTGVNRDIWTKARSQLLQSGSQNNAKTLEAIEKAAFVVCLDTNKPVTGGSDEQRADFSRLLWHGDENNRWWDKPVQWVVFENGESGILGEHSCMDGSPTARMNNDMTIALMAGKAPPEPVNASEEVAKAEFLTFDVDKETQRDIRGAVDEYHQAINDVQLRYLLYDSFGKDGIKAIKTSPDGFCQMAMQLAFALTFNGESSGTYEAANVRRYDLGRTECVRVCTPEVRAWIESMLDDQTSDDSRRQLFRTAIAQHGKDMKDAGNGKGIDRHLFGLKLRVQKDEETPALFKNELYQRAGYWRLSTSQVVGEHFLGYGWGCVVPNGFGFAYLLRNKNLQFTITSRSGQATKELVGNVKKALDTVMDLMKGESSPALGSKM